MKALSSLLLALFALVSSPAQADSFSVADFNCYKPVAEADYKQIVRHFNASRDSIDLLAKHCRQQAEAAKNIQDITAAWAMVNRISASISSSRNTRDVYKGQYVAVDMNDRFASRVEGKILETPLYSGQAMVSYDFFGWQEKMLGSYQYYPELFSPCYEGSSDRPKVCVGDSVIFNDRRDQGRVARVYDGWVLVQRFGGDVELQYPWHVDYISEQGSEMDRAQAMQDLYSRVCWGNSDMPQSLRERCEAIELE